MATCDAVGNREQGIYILLVFPQAVVFSLSFFCEHWFSCLNQISLRFSLLNIFYLLLLYVSVQRIHLYHKEDRYLLVFQAEWTLNEHAACFTVNKCRLGSRVLWGLIYHRFIYYGFEQMA